MEHNFNSAFSPGYLRDIGLQYFNMERGRGQKLWCGIRLHPSSTLPIHLLPLARRGYWLTTSWCASIGWETGRLLICIYGFSVSHMPLKSDFKSHRCVWPFCLSQKDGICDSNVSWNFGDSLDVVIRCFAQVMWVGVFAVQKPFSWSEIEISGLPAFKLLLLHHVIPIGAWLCLRFTVTE